MTLGRSHRLAASAALAAVLAAWPAAPARADITVVGGFTSTGDIGFTPATSPPSLSVTFGTGLGSIYQMDTFVNAPADDFGVGTGVSQQLSNGPIAQLATTFNATQLDANNLQLDYTYRNVSGSLITGLKLFYYIDPDIAVPGATAPADFATVAGAPGSPPFAASYQVGDPQLSTIFTNLLAGTLSNTNDVPSTSPGDVSMALGFNIGNLAAGATATLRVLLSDNGRSLPGGLVLTERNNAPAASGDVLTVSGLASVAVPEPSPLALAGLAALVGLAARRLRRSR
ncbi:MAG: PEP-CTERM sorting domain-containing protein [Isosphaeraceae bacterium]